MGTRNKIHRHVPSIVEGTLKTVRKLTAAISVSLIAFFELCFTGRADGAWRIARAENQLKILSSKTAGAKVTPAEHPDPRLRNLYLVKGRAYIPSFPPEPALFFLSRLLIVFAVVVLIIAGALLSVESPGGQSLHQLEDGSERSLSTADSGTGTEAPSSEIGRAEKAVVVGCVISLIMIAAVIYLNAIKKQNTENRRQNGYKNR